MNSHDRTLDPDQISRTPSGEVELIALDEILIFAQAAMYENITPLKKQDGFPQKMMEVLIVRQ